MVDQKKADPGLRALVDYFDKLDEKELATITPAGVAAVAEARFMMGEAVLARALDIKISGRERTSSRRPPRSSGDRRGPTRIFEDVYGFKHPQWQIRRAEPRRRGVCRAGRHDRELACPRELNHEQCENLQAGAGRQGREDSRPGDRLLPQVPRVRLEGAAVVQPLLG